MMVNDLSVEHALHTILSSEGRDPGDLDAAQLRRAAIVLMGEVSRFKAQQAVREAIEKPRLQLVWPGDGQALVELEDDDGPRHYLFGYPVAPGASLVLLTERCRLQGKYAWSGRTGTRPTFQVWLAGVRDPIECVIPVDAALEWPDAVR